VNENQMMRRKMRVLVRRRLPGESLDPRRIQKKNPPTSHPPGQKSRPALRVPSGCRKTGTTLIMPQRHRAKTAKTQNRYRYSATHQAKPKSNRAQKNICRPSARLPRRRTTVRLVAETRISIQ
jgi:hypothetical protein